MKEDGCPECHRPWMPKSIPLADYQQYCCETADDHCIEGQRDILLAACVGLVNWTVANLRSAAGAGNGLLECIGNAKDALPSKDGGG